MIFFPSRSKKVTRVINHEKIVLNSTEDMESLIDLEKKSKKSAGETKEKLG